jgi:hypothetical protein
VDDGLTEREAGLEVIPVCVIPSDHVTFQGACPVSAAWIVADPPAQMLVFPLTTAVGESQGVVTACTSTGEMLPERLASPE